MRSNTTVKKCNLFEFVAALNLSTSTETAPTETYYHTTPNHDSHAFTIADDCQQMYVNRKPARLHVWIGLCGSSARMFE